MNKQHTPGPWNVGSTDDSACRIYADAYQNHAIARTYGQELNGIGICQLTGPKNRADARLIAAAPELLEACLAMIEWDARENDHAVNFQKRMELCELSFQKARAAIAKATGEQA